jgi:diacylglycerol kinase (ATP)
MQRAANSTMRVTVVHNADAGSGALTDAELEHWIEAAGHTSTLVPRDDGDALTAALRDPGDLVVVAGGDGSVRSVGERLATAGSGVPLAILPMGTANNVATSLGIGTDHEALIAGWAHGRRQPFDVGRVSAPWGSSLFFEACGFGSIARAMSALAPIDAPPAVEGQGEELERDLRVTRELLADHPLHDCRVTLDGRVVTGRFAVVEAMNIPMIGANIALAPHASTCDGLLDIVLVDDHARLRLRDYLTARLEGHGQVLVELPVYRARKVHIAWEGCRVHVDDEIRPSEEAAAASAYWSGPLSLELDVGIIPAALTVLVPA